MANEEREQHDSVEEVTARNVAGMRELLDEKARQHDTRGTEPPLADDPAAAQENPQAHEPSAGTGSAGGTRNLSGGRS